MTHLIALTDNFWQLFVISAPWLLLGLFIAGLIKVYLPKDFLIKHLGKEGFISTLKAASLSMSPSSNVPRLWFVADDPQDRHLPES